MPKISNLRKFIYIRFSSYLLILLPVFFITGPFLPDLTISLIALIFLVNSYENKLITYYRSIFFYFFIFFYISILICSLFSYDAIYSLKTTIPYIRFAIFSLAVWYLLKHNDYIFIYLFFSFLLCYSILIGDGLFQYFLS